MHVTHVIPFNSSTVRFICVTLMGEKNRGCFVFGTDVEQMHDKIVELVNEPLTPKVQERFNLMRQHFLPSDQPVQAPVVVAGLAGITGYHTIPVGANYILTNQPQARISPDFLHEAMDTSVNGSPTDHSFSVRLHPYNGTRLIGCIHRSIDRTALERYYDVRINMYMLGEATSHIIALPDIVTVPDVLVTMYVIGASQLRP